MKIIEITAQQKDRYNHFVQSHPLGSIHQAWEWGLFQSKNADRDRFWVFALVDEKDKISASALIIRQKLPFGKSWLYCPRGPLIDYSNPEKFEALFKKIEELAHQQNAVFFRFDPGLLSSQNPKILLPNSQVAHAHYQPQDTVILDLKTPAEELLKNMKMKCRYNIKIAQKRGVRIREIQKFSPLDIKTFYSLLQQTTARDQFAGHSSQYYENMLHILGSEKSKLYLADYQGKTIAGLIITYFKDTATYYFGASSNEYRNVMAPYLLQWQAIQDAQKRGYHFYDFLGIAPENEPNHPWAGVTHFKLKFGGMRVTYVPAQERVYQPFWYRLIRFMKKLRSLRR